MADEKTKTPYQEECDKQDAAAKAAGAIVVIRVKKTGEDKEYLAYLKKPDRYAIGVFLSKMNDNLILACEAIYVSAVMKDISPDHTAIFEDDELFTSAHKAIQAAVPFKKNSSMIL